MTDSDPLDIDRLQRRSAQAMVATFLQMARHAELAHSLQKARANALERRIGESSDMQEVARLRRQLEAQRDQGANIQSAVQRFRRRASDSVSFSDMGLTEDDIEAFGLKDAVRPGEQPGEQPGAPSDVKDDDGPRDEEP